MQDDCPKTNRNPVTYPFQEAMIHDIHCVGALDDIHQFSRFCPIVAYVAALLFVRLFALAVNHRIKVELLFCFDNARSVSIHLSLLEKTSAGFQQHLR